VGVGENGHDRRGEIRRGGGAQEPVTANAGGWILLNKQGEMGGQDNETGNEKPRYPRASTKVKNDHWRADGKVSARHHIAGLRQTHDLVI